MNLKESSAITDELYEQLLIVNRSLVLFMCFLQVN